MKFWMIFLLFFAGMESSVAQVQTFAVSYNQQTNKAHLGVYSERIANRNDITTGTCLLQPGDNLVVEFERDENRMKSERPIRPDNGSRGYGFALPDWFGQGYAFLGIQSRSVSKEKAKALGFDNAYGSYVTRVLGNTAAERAGLQPFDYIFGVDEYRTGEEQSLTGILRKFTPGDQATVHFIRRNQKKEASVIFGSSEEARRETVSRCEEPFFGIRSTNEFPGQEGIPVEIVPNSTAEALGMKNGDAILTINRFPVIDWDDIGTVIDNMTTGQTIIVEFWRNGKKMKSDGPIKSYCDTREGPSSAPATPRSPGKAAVNVQLEDISNQEADEMKSRFGISLQSDNDLRIEQLSLSPNPTSGQFLLQFNLPEKGTTTIRIYNISGRLIYLYDLGSFSGEFTDEVDISWNTPGVYFLQIRQDNRSLTKKIVLR